MEEQSDIMKISDVAKATGLNKSTVSRIVKVNPDLIHGKNGRSILISKTAFNLVRSRTINPAKSGNHAGLVAGELPLTPDADASVAPVVSGSALTDARTRLESAKAEQAEMNLKIKQGQYVAVSEVEQNIFDIFRMLRDEIMAQAARSNVELASMSDPKEVKSYLTDMNKRMLSSLAQKIKFKQDK